MEFTFKRKSGEKIIITQYQTGENKWLLAIRAAIEIKANLREADLSWANLSGANLRWANLSEADLDFSSGFAFKCTSFAVKLDLKIAAQLAYHFCRFDFGDCEEAKQAQKSLTDLANKFHRVKECGRIE